MNKSNIEIVLIRHGMTEGNKDKKYIGITDEALCTDGRKMLEDIYRNIKFEPDMVFVSPLIRCRETAEALFPGKNQIVIEELAEMDFGIFENRAFKGDLEYDADYQKWLDTMCEGDVPGGENKNIFTERCIAGFEKAIDEAGKAGAEKAAFVVHGGTIMSIMSKYGEPEREYYQWHVENGHGYAGRIKNGRITDVAEM